MTDRPSSNDSSSGPGPEVGPKGSPKGAPDKAPGLGEQFGRTRRALLGLVAAHIRLARAEFAEIGGEIKRAAALGGLALLLLFVAAMLIVIGALLCLGEAIFGSIGWGVLDGAELLIGVGVLLILAIVDLGWRRTFSAFVVALGVGLIVAGLLGVDWNWVGHHYSACRLRSSPPSS